MEILIKAKEIYEEIMKYHWFFELEDGKIVKLIFNEEHFTHLIFGTKVNDGLGKYKGKDGYSEILKVDYSIIEAEIKSNPKINLEAVNIKNRVTYFSELENI